MPLWYDIGLASAVKDVVGHPVKLANISIEPLPPKAWLLTGFVLGPDLDRGGEGQSTAQTAQSAEKVSQGALRPRLRSQSSGIPFGGSGEPSVSGDDASNMSDASSNRQEYSQERVEHGDSDEESDGLGGSSGWKSRHIKGSEWAPSEDEHLRMWVARDARSNWKAIYRRLPKRTDGSVYLRGQKIRKEMA